jgi:transcriptional regulator with GAF, ATPase, and Fis domain
MGSNLSEKSHQATAMTDMMSKVPLSKSRHLSLFVLIPVIFTGLSILSGIVAFHYSKYYLKGLKPSWEITLWLVAIIGFTFVCGLLITWLLLKPVKTFIKEAEKLPIFSGGTLSDKKSLNVNEIDHFNMVFQQVTHLLGKVEAKELFPEIIGQSNIMRGLFSQILKVASTDATVLIMGESGTGKELIATSIYEHSPRKDKPFVKLSCVAIPEGLLESELFGHEKGAFTGAISRKIGKFELANTGTILLDEIGDMPLETQAKLLRVLQEKEFERVGGTRPIKVDVRFIAATNKDLQEMVKEGKFREDLFYRINAFTMVLPPLSERKDDIPLLISHFLEVAPKPARLSSDALQILMNYTWPGNIRELRNTVERVALMADDGVIDPPDIPANILTASGMDRIDYRKDRKDEEESHSSEKISIDDRLRDLEKKMIMEALLSTQGVQARAAELLGIKERSLWHRIKKFEIDISSLKEGK